MAYGILKCDTVTFTDAGIDKSVTLSGLVQNPTFSGNVTVTGTLSGVTVTGTTANFTSGNFTNISGGTQTIASGVFAAGSAANPSITFTGDLNTGIYSPGADQLAISTAGSGRLFVNASGNIGVGANNAQNYSGFTNVAINGTQGGAIDLCASAVGVGSNRVAQLSGINGGSFVLATGAADTMVERLRITSAGLVGVGTSSPAQTLHVNGSGTQYFQVSSTTNDATTLLGATSSGSFLINQSTTLPTQIWTNGSARIHISSAGNVGVGTTSPQRTLHVSTSDNVPLRLTTTNANNYIQLDNAGGLYYIAAKSGNNLVFEDNFGERARIDSSGRLGIGTSSPVVRLHVQSGLDGDGISIAHQNTPSGGQGPSLAFRHSTNNGTQQNFAYIKSLMAGGGDTTWDSHLVFGTGGYQMQERVRITNAGNVGIGTTSPGEKLTVVGSDNSANFRVKGSSSSGDFFIYNNASTNQVALSTNLTTTDMAFAIGGNEAIKIDTSRRLLVGTSTARTNFFNGVTAAAVQIEGSLAANRSLSVFGNTGDAFSAGILILGASRGTSAGSNTIVQNGDELGIVAFQGTDGSEPVEAARIGAFVDGTPGANDMPGRLVFSTTADGASSPTERMRITSDAYVRLASGTGGIQFNGDTAAANALDDYEEGTWTGNYSTGGSFSGTYTKIGNSVNIRVFHNNGVVGRSFTANAVISGLPFSVFGTGTFVVVNDAIPSSVQGEAGCYAYGTTLYLRNSGTINFLQYSTFVLSLTGS